MRTFAYRLYLIFVVSWFLHMPTRIKPLGALRLDMVLLGFISLLIFFSKPKEDSEDPMAEELATPPTTKTEKIIKVMLAYIVLSLPLVQWPGSVVFHGLPDYIKAIVFYFFTINLITSEQRLKTFMMVFLAAQSFRVIEPAFLHVTTGYWGSVASMANWEAMDRLSGAPSDVINPNGLAFVIVTVFPFLHYLTDCGWKNKLIYAVISPILVYALLLTASRTGFVCLGVILAQIWWRSRNKFALTIVVVIGAVVSIGLMSSNLKDRYLSIVDSDTKNARTAQGRLTGLEENLDVAMRKPFVGHGLGTSAEANANYGSYGKIAHNLIAEILEELGFIGLFIFIALVRSIWGNFRESLKAMRARADNSVFLSALAESMQVWLFMNMVFSLASFGFSSYEWYLFAGLSVVLKRLVESRELETPQEPEAASETDPYIQGLPT